ncbi:uncharacterized protein LOC107963974 isoform X3 [Apis mellifera]|uniref:Uncharacterized protein LOC107963974 isoform X3 n=1 Tax=Apis mellifera TaxID=7460 RepID=A0A7M7MNT7_APIME|nr:uncharacterized protein LOC107963974 isoform X3 [Apis mellifera]|eukprot:XP_026298582.1 uncharacterized protein LOC107963974 isoform X3 [Apis mellifera]
MRAMELFQPEVKPKYRVNFKIAMFPYTTIFSHVAGFKLVWLLPTGAEITRFVRSVDDVHQAAEIVYESLGNYNPWNSGEEVGFLAEGFPNLPNAASVSAVSFHPCPSFPSLPPIRVEKSLFAPSVGSIRRRTNQRFSPVIYTDKIYGREC